MEGKKLISTIILVSCKTLLIVLALLMLIFLGRKAYGFSRKVFVEAAYTDGGRAISATITIPADYDTKDIAQTLEENGIVEDYKIFWAQVRLSDYYKKFIPGTYEVDSSMTPTEIMVIFSTPEEEETEE